LLEYFAFGFAHDLAEFVLELVFPELKLPCLPVLDGLPDVAVLCCICDDADRNTLRKLGNCQYDGTHWFILDDSKNQGPREIVDSLGFTVIRRDARKGYKAGNLNNWLAKHGDRFPYFVVLDSDSLLAPDFVKRMLHYAEHPSNHDVAVFESVIMPWNVFNGFVYWQSLIARVARREPLRIGNRFASNFSAGHNNLFRTSAVKEIGGFTEKYIAEDYATWIKLIQNKWRSITVPVESYERAPMNLVEYTKRRARHACQTFELASMSLRGISWTARLRLLKALHFYSLPIIGLLSAIFLIYINAGVCLSGINLESTTAPGYSTIVIFWSIITVLMLVCPAVRSRAEGIPISSFIRSIFFEGAVFTLASWTVASKLIRYWAGRPLQFNVTGIESKPSFISILKMSTPGLLIYFIALISILINPYFSGLNLVWAIPAVISPIIVYESQKVRNVHQG
jgi:cellulose synthase/poly-beta-1,6-N-acetylglucosamine synthase-like glycosyltransferase